MAVERVGQPPEFERNDSGLGNSRKSINESSDTGSISSTNSEGATKSKKVSRQGSESSLRLQKQEVDTRILTSGKAQGLTKTSSGKFSAIKNAFSKLIPGKGKEGREATIAKNALSQSTVQEKPMTTEEKLEMVHKGLTILKEDIDTYKSTPSSKVPKNSQSALLKALEGYKALAKSMGLGEMEEIKSTLEGLKNDIEYAPSLRNDIEYAPSLREVKNLLFGTDYSMSDTQRKSIGEKLSSLLVKPGLIKEIAANALEGDQLHDKITSFVKQLKGDELKDFLEPHVNTDSFVTLANLIGADYSMEPPKGPAFNNDPLSMETAAAKLLPKNSEDQTQFMKHLVGLFGVVNTVKSNIVQLQQHLKKLTNEDRRENENQIEILKLDLAEKQRIFNGLTAGLDKVFDSIGSLTSQGYTQLVQNYQQTLIDTHDNLALASLHGDVQTRADIDRHMNAVKDGLKEISSDAPAFIQDAKNTLV